MTDNQAPTILVLSLPYPPSVNNYYGKRRGQKKYYLKPEVKKFRKEVSIAVLMNPKSHRSEITGDIKMDVWVTPPNDHRDHDIDNLNKALFDSLQHAGVFENDAQVKELSMHMLDPVDTAAEPGVKVILDWGNYE